MKTAVIQIGNSDDKLPQLIWSQFVGETGWVVNDFSSDIHFFGCSQGNARWQNACWVFELSKEEHALTLLADRLSRLAKKFSQDSIALTIGETRMELAR